MRKKIYITKQEGTHKETIIEVQVANERFSTEVIPYQELMASLTSRKHKGLGVIFY